MKDVIEILLLKKEALETDKEAEKIEACKEIDAKYAERSTKIEALLDMAGYVPQNEEQPAIIEEVAEVVNEEPTQTPATEIIY